MSKSRMFDAAIDPIREILRESAAKICTPMPVTERDPPCIAPHALDVRQHIRIHATMSRFRRHASTYAHT